MDVERIQKINNLAVDLLKQGLAQSREDAIAQAEKVFQGKDSEEYDSLRETLGEVKKEVEEILEPQQHREVENSVELSHDQVKNILHQNTQFVVKKMREFQEKISVFEKEMSELRTKLTYNRLPTANDMVQKETEVKQEQQTSVEGNIKGNLQPTQEKTASKEEVKESHPRSGNYNNSDVSIEKFFYMGSK